MIVYIPSDRIVPKKVISSITKYGHTVEVYTKHYSDNRYMDLGYKRNDIVAKAQYNNSRYIAMNDSDVTHTKDNFMEMENFLDNNPDWAGVALVDGSLRKGLEPRHVNLHCCMFRKGIEINFMPQCQECECMAATRMLRQHWHFGYLNGTDRIIHKK